MYCKIGNGNFQGVGGVVVVELKKDKILKKNENLGGGWDCESESNSGGLRYFVEILYVYL